MHLKVIKRTQIVLLLFMLGKVCSAQPESFTTLTDSLVRQEIAMFSFKGASVKGSHSPGQPALIEIPLRNCDGKTVNLYKGSTFIHLYFSQASGEVGQPVIHGLDSIFLVTHSHFWVRIPKSAYVGLKDLIPCDHGDTKKNPYHSPFFKAFQSMDNGRIYIYMIAGADRERYEVTWVIKDSKFYTRIMDPI